MTKPTIGQLNTKATMAGGGLGTIMVAIAGQLGPGNELWSALLTYSAPGLSVAGAAAWVMLAAQMKSWRSNYVVDRALKRARRIQARITNTPGASQSLKDHAAETVEHLERLAMTMIKAELEVVEATLLP